MKLLFFLYVLVSLVTVIFSYGFTDPNLVLTETSLFVNIYTQLRQIVYTYGGLASLITGGIIVLFFVLYLRVLSSTEREEKDRKTMTRSIMYLVIIVGFMFLLSYPMFSYDIFNYILTAKLTYVWKENPYIVMPVEITNEPNLAFTRAANKLALYGPTWIASSFLPSIVGFSHVWLSIIAFKTLVGVWYGIFIWMIYRYTKSLWNVVFFALNPLILSEILMNGHNDIVMIVLAIAGLMLVMKKGMGNLVLGIVSIVASILVKGATVVLFPLLFFNWSHEHVWKVGFWLMFGIFLLTPVREELYPWYAIWFLSFAALLPHRKVEFIHNLSIAFSFGLLFRHLPYIATREYGGLAPLWRTILTLVPVAIYIAWRTFKKYV